MFWRRRRLRKGLATLHAAARMRQSLKGTFARQRLRLTRQAFWKWQLCVFVHGGVHTPVWEVLGGTLEVFREVFKAKNMKFFQEVFKGNKR